MRLNSTCTLTSIIGALVINSAALAQDANTANDPQPTPAPPTSCVDFHAVGAIPEGTFLYIKDQNGNWAKSIAFLGATFEVEEKVRFTTPNGLNLVTVRVNAPGYDPVCTFYTVRLSDVVFYQ